ncbi:MAG: hypothetical protein RBS80_01770 [Thermoguttaceae bacterium]|jgi:hypothetical protein|nr:hypothetical protein [Thermoguttaceae bacterium]
MSDGWIAIAAGGNFGAALHRQGFAFTWGHGLARGDGEQADIATPLPRAVMTHTYRPPTRLWQPATDFFPTPLWFFH